MTYDKILELKKEVDELSIYYQVLKEKSQILDEKYYSNNLSSNIEDEEETDLIEDDDVYTITDLFSESSNVFNKLFAHLFRLAFIVIGYCVFDFSVFMYYFLIIVNLLYYFYCVFFDKDEENEEELEIIDEVLDIEDLQEEKEKMDRRLEYVRDKFMKISREYEKLVANLNEKEYQEYLEYISEYLQYMLEHSEEILSEVEDNYVNIDEEIFESEELVEEKKDKFRLYELK